MNRIDKSIILRADFYFLPGRNNIVYISKNHLTEEESYEYNPWGVLLTSASKNNLLYTARDFDFDINLQFNRMRYCSPNLGRFTSKDGLFSENYFLYASNDPIGFYDPLGLAIWHYIAYIFPGGPCTHSSLSECLECCSQELKHNLAGCRCPYTNSSCKEADYSRDVSCRTGRRGSYT